MYGIYTYLRFLFFLFDILIKHLKAFLDRVCCVFFPGCIHRVLYRDVNKTNNWIKELQCLKLILLTVQNYSKHWTCQDNVISFPDSQAKATNRGSLHDYTKYMITLNCQ